MSVISINKVSKSYGKVQAVSELNLQVNEGEIYGFIGPNGAGKSTTIRMLLNFISYDSGSISVLGFDPAREDIEIKKHTGYVASDTVMYSDMKVSELFRFTESFHGIKAGDRIDMLIARIERYENSVQAFEWIDPQRALDLARRADRRPSAQPVRRA